MKLSENYLWEVIEGFKWNSDNNWRRISLEFSLENKTYQRDLKQFVDDRMKELDDRFRKDWLGTPGINVSDDGWSDLRAEVIGRGQMFYKSISVKKLQKMANAVEYTENFTYGIRVVDNPKLLSQYSTVLDNIKSVEGVPYKVKSEKHRLLYSYYLELELIYKLLTTAA